MSGFPFSTAFGAALIAGQRRPIFHALIAVFIVLRTIRKSIHPVLSDALSSLWPAEIIFIRPRVTNRVPTHRGIRHLRHHPAWIGSIYRVVQDVAVAIEGLRVQD